ncbi:hypothetical protein CLOP_g11196, partial [Closterium sp. NIES-67]
MHQEDMEQLKQALTSAPVLILADPERDYVIEADASDQAVGAVLMQDQGNRLQPIAYLSKKLHGAELSYPIHDKEALAIIIAFKSWRCYIEGRKTTVYTDHCSLKYLKTKPSLSRRQVRWIDFVKTHFHYNIVYKPGHKNKADALSRPAHETAQLFVRYIISQHGIPTTLISDRDPKFTSKFWKELMSLLEPNSPCHPHTIRRQMDKPSASTKLWSNSSAQPVRTKSPSGTCICPSWSLPTTILLTPLLDRRRSSSVMDDTHSYLNSQTYQP